MQAPSFRMNEREANPNPYIAFIRSLAKKKDNTDAEQILKAVAAQMKKIMEKRFMFVGTLEEAEFNRVFAGRNWNHGQSIELVLRGPSGRFLPLPYITSVMCHEMAHIEQMNHGPKFQKLMAEIKADVREMQARGYYGDGFWSDGKRLKDSVRMGAEGLRPSDFPEYVCGVTAGDAAKATRPRRGPGSSRSGLVKGEPSHLSGRQTEYRRKAGRKNNADMGENGARLDGQRQITKTDRDERKRYIDDRVKYFIAHGISVTKAKASAIESYDQTHPWFKAGNTRGKVAKSRTAAEMRAAAAERRLAALAGPSQDIKPLVKAEEGDLEAFSDDEEGTSAGEGQGDEDVLDPHMGTEERKREMEDEMSEDEINGLRGGWEAFISEDAGLIAGHDPGPSAVTAHDRVKRERSPDSPGVRLAKKAQTTASTSTSSKQLRRSEAVKQERLESSQFPSSTASRTEGGSRNPSRPSIGTPTSPAEVVSEDQIEPDRPGADWTCRLCTYINLANHGRCEMCLARPDGTVPHDDGVAIV